MTFYAPPPFAAPPPPPDPSLQALNEVTGALRTLAADNLLQYVVESKKLSLAVLDASEVTRTLQNRGMAVDGPAILRRELENHTRAFALMRMLSPEEIKQAVQAANVSGEAALARTPPGSRVQALVAELEAVAGGRLDAEKLDLELQAQPLFRLLSDRPAVFSKLEGLYDQCAESIPRLLKSTNQALSQLRQQQRF